MAQQPEGHTIMKIVMACGRDEREIELPYDFEWVQVTYALLRAQIRHMDEEVHIAHFCTVREDWFFLESYCSSNKLMKHDHEVPYSDIIIGDNR